MNPKKRQSAVKTRSIRGAVRKNAMPFALRLFMIGACAFPFAVSSRADTVSGHIYGQDGKPVAAMTFAAKPAKGDTVEFKTNGAGSFSVFLDPGRYTISSTTDPGLQGVLDSLPQPVQQDVHLKKGG
jgi:hypothetical protein